MNQAPPQSHLQVERLALALPLALLLAGLSACTANGSAPEVRTDQLPVQTADGWRTASLPEVGINPGPIREMASGLQKGAFPGISSVVLARHGRLVFEEYYGGFDRERIHNTSSASKSVTSALLGIAVDKGFIPGADARLLPYFPEYDGKIDHWDARKEDITLAHVLSMSSGMKCNEDEMYPTDDWIKFYLDQPLAATPGEAFSYNTCGVVALGTVITKSSGLRIPAFADRYLFGPLGITAYKWPITNSLGSQGLAMTGGGLSLRPRDMAKFGQLFLNGGQWNGEQIISEAWIGSSTRKHATSDLHGEAYGFLWRMIDRTVNGRSIHSIEAWGNGGQFIMVFPDLQLVAVFTGENYGRFPEMEQPFVLLDRYILPAVE